MLCSIPDCGKPCEGRTTKCASHNREDRKALQAASKEKRVYVIPIDAKFKPLKVKKPKKPIPKVSGKMAKYLARYSKQKAKWIKGKKCAFYPHLPATTVHHSRGRVGFADSWARENDIPLLLDERFWVPASGLGHIEIEKSPLFSKEKGFSASRLEKLD